MFIGVFLQFLQDLAVGIWRCDFAFDIGCVEFSFVLKRIEMLCSCLGVNVLDGLPFLEEHAIDANIRFYLNQIPIDQVPIANGLFVVVAKHDFVKVARGVTSRRGSQSNAEGIEVI